MASDIERALAEQWSFRAQAEHEARARFVELGQAMMRHSPPRGVLDAVRQAPEEERRHRDACAALAMRFGHQGAAWRSRGLPRIGPRELDDLSSCLWLTTSVCCLAETMNVALLTETLRHVRDPSIRSVTRRILADEVRHARLGWGFVTAHRGALGFLAPHWSQLIEAAVVDELFVPDEQERAVPEWGLLGRKKLLELFLRTLEGVVLPGFESLGVDVASARSWMRARASVGESAAPA